MDRKKTTEVIDRPHRHWTETPANNSLVELNHHTIRPERQGKSLAAGLQHQINSIGVLQPHFATALITDGPPFTHLAVNTVDVLQITHIVDGAGGIEARDTEAADPQPAKLE